MAEPELFTLDSTSEPYKFQLQVEPRICVGPPDSKFLFGGVGMASSVASLERALQRPLLWATTQYISYAQPGSAVDIEVIAPKIGKSVTQARVIARVGEREIFTTNAALGERGMEIEGQWASAQVVPKPEDCKPLEFPGANNSKDLHTQLDTRVAKGIWGWRNATNEASPDGEITLWARARSGKKIDQSMLCIIADYVPGASGPALGMKAGANSLDNTIRIVRTDVETEWVMCCLKIYAVHDGFVHGRAHLFAEDGTLMATASQSCILRVWPGGEPPAGIKRD